MNQSSIQCPHCRSEFDISMVLRKELEETLKTEMNLEAAAWKKKQAEEYKRKAEELRSASEAREQQWRKEKNRLEQQQLQEAAEKTAALKKQWEEMELLKKLVQEGDQLRLCAVQQAEEVTRQQLKEEHEKMMLEAKVRLQVSAREECQNELNLEKEKATRFEEKLRKARETEMELLRREADLKKQAEEAEFEMKKQMLAERERLASELKDQELRKRDALETAHLMQIRSLEEKLQQQVAAAEEMKRKAEQGSMQLQGEVQELILQEELSRLYPFDTVAEVGKGVRGADCIQTVHTQYGQSAGKIIYESKRTGNFNKEWIEKLKMDMVSHGAEIAVIVTQAMPGDMPRFGQKDGVYICNFMEVRSVSLVLRNALLSCHDVRSASTNKSDKMSLLYDYLTSTEFGLQWKMVTEVFMQLRQSIVTERAAMEKLWKAREKQLDKALHGAVQIQGSIEGIAGQNQISFALAGELDAAYDPE